MTEKGIGGTKPSEIKEIMDKLGRDNHEGQVSGSHLGKILSFLQIENSGNLKATTAQLALVCGMKARYVKEDYLDGMICFDIIRVTTVNNQTMWKWNGIKAFTDKAMRRIEHGNGDGN